MKLDARITRWLRARTATIKAREVAVTKPKPWRVNNGGANIRGRMAMAQTNPPAYLPATALDRFEVWAAVEPGGLWELPGQPDYIERPAMALDVVRALRQAGDYASIQVVRLNRYGGVDRVVFDIQRGPDGIWKRTNFPLAPDQPMTEVGSSQSRG